MEIKEYIDKNEKLHVKIILNNEEIAKRQEMQKSVKEILAKRKIDELIKINPELSSLFIKKEDDKISSDISVDLSVDLSNDISADISVDLSSNISNDIDIDTCPDIDYQISNDVEIF
jgi:hypothetical protein